MTTKIEAGKIATLAGTAMLIAQGHALNPLGALRTGGRHTLFHPMQSRAQARKRWIMGTLQVAGTLTLDAGAVRALRGGKSLLPVGVTQIAGTFARGDTVAILAPDGQEIARGLAGLGSTEANLVKGKHGAAIHELLGPDTRIELVHRDNMVLLSAMEAVKP
jgi:glutamate 5-kinase